MRIAVALCLLGPFICRPSLADDRIAIEVGAGVHWSVDTEASMVRYARDLGQLQDFVPLNWGPVYTDVSIASWNGAAANNVVALSLGLRHPLEHGFYVSAAAGVGYSEHTTAFVATRGLLTARLATGVVINRYDLALAYSHYSNGKPLFQWQGPNRGYDYVTLQLGYVF